MIRTFAGRCATPIPRAEPEPDKKLTAVDLRDTLTYAFPIGRQSIANIQNTVSAFYGIEPRYMRTPDNVPGLREPRVSHPRQVAMFFARELTRSSLPVIGSRFGGRDHTTVLYALKAVERRAASDPFLEAELEVLRERLST